jgi:thioredoxin reductase (NADPH)
VESVSLRDRRADCIEPVAATAVFVMIGAVPCSEAAVGMLALDPAGYLLCGTGAASCDGHLACAVAVRFVHDLLAA